MSAMQQLLIALVDQFSLTDGMKVFNPRFNTWILWIRDQEWYDTLGFLLNETLLNYMRYLANLLPLMGYNEEFIGN